LHYFIDPFGCVKNQVDAETIMGSLNLAGRTSAEDAEDADIIIINSCGFIESAKQESINAVLGWKDKYPDKKIILAGCLAQRYAKDLAESLPEADGLFGNTDLGGIVETAEKLINTGAVESAASSNSSFQTPNSKFSTPNSTLQIQNSFLPGQRPLLSLPGSAYVKIAEGCNNCCTFCSIPLIRGSLRSRPIPEILAECRSLLDRGIKELCIIGQDLGSYGKDISDNTCLLPDLLEALSKFEDNFWVRLLYIHPDNFPQPILDIMERDKRFLPYFDLPFQHASEKILAAMNRTWDIKNHLRLITLIRSRLGDAVIRSTFLLGFPGETDEDFTLLLDFQEKAHLDWLGCFTYSREEDTPAYAMKGQVPRKIATERKRIIEERQISISEQQMDRFVGRTMDVLLEEAVDEEDGLYLGRLYCQAPEVDGAAVITAEGNLSGLDMLVKPGTGIVPGTFYRGKVTGRAGFDLEVRVN
jgi:ribosomal protein S12 methylthiotransferase